MKIKSALKYSLIVVLVLVSFLSGILFQFFFDNEKKVYVRIHDYVQIISRDIANINTYKESDTKDLIEKINSDTFVLLNMVGRLLKSLDERPEGHVKLAVDSAIYNMPNLENPDFLMEKKAEAYDIEGLEYLISIKEPNK